MITNVIRSVPRTVLNTYLRAARLPLTAAERIAKQQGNEAWPPALAFESAQAGVETVVGSLLRDAELIENGRLRQAKVAKLRQAGELKTEAELEKEQGRQAEQQRKAEIAQQRKQTMQAAKQRKENVEQQAAVEERKAETKAAKKAAAVREQKAKQEKFIERRERSGRAEALDAEAKALEIVKDALEAEEKVDVIDATIEGNKEARKTG
jgi:hypothetical protein